MNDAVIVGSGINSLACAALLARAGWEVRVLEREDVIGAIQTAELTEPGYLHDVFSAWHPLWVGSAAHAEARRRARRPRARVPEHGPADRDRVPGRRVRVPAPHRRGERRRARRGLGRPAGVVLPERGPRLRDPRHRALVEGRPLAGAQGLPRLGRRGLAAFAGDLAISSCDCDGHLRVRADPRPSRSVGTAPVSVPTPPPRPHDAGDRGRRPEGGMPIPRGGESEARRRRSSG